jgi:hypothetical protein
MLWDIRNNEENRYQPYLLCFNVPILLVYRTAVDSCCREVPLLGHESKTVFFAHTSLAS